LDLENSHPSTLKIIVDEKADQEKGASGECSGVLIAPRLVLTAGHCVCMTRQLSVSESDELKGASPRIKPPTDSISRLKTIQNFRIHARIDNSRCAKAAKVQVVSYEPPEPSEPDAMRVKKYRGQVRPHPELELLYDEEGSVVWNSADLAVILLEDSVKNVPVARLATTEARDEMPIVLTGFGPGDSSSAFGERHSGQNQITWLRRLDSGSIEIVAAMQRMPDGRPGSHLQGGDSGGGCWSRAEDGGEVLIGIASGAAQNRQGETFSIFTSLYPHEGWLRQHLEEALKKTRSSAAAKVTNAE
jgi:hypothetical protein